MPGMIALDEDNLMSRINERDQSALAELYDTCGRAIYNLAYRVLDNAGFAEEITQDTFLIVWTQPERWRRERGSLVGWMLTIARNASIDRLRKEERRPMRGALDLDDLLERLSMGSERDHPDWSDGETLRVCLDGLPVEQAQAIQLAFYQGLTHDEMAQKLRLPLGTVKTRVRLGLQKLRTCWGDP
ncbi:MAG: sigma-70 family RNA polymerase sigma factor [Chloroflexota bacterium]|nr:sigma-70 family RNA polymerase sigma factor [Chloroflexota bacterium]